MRNIIFFTGSSNSRSDKVKINVAGSLIVKGISIVISLLLVPLTLGYVSADLYGVWLTLSSMSVWLGFFDIGFTLGLKNLLTEALAVDDFDQGKRLVSTTYAILAIIITPLCFLLTAIVPLLDWCNLLNVSIVYKDDIIISMNIIIVSFSLQMVLSIVNTIFQSLQKVALSSLFPVIGNALSLLAVYGATLFVKPSLIVLACCISALPILVYIISSVYLFCGKLKYLAPNFHYIDFSLFPDIFKLGAKFFIIQIQVVVFFQTTNFLISNISTPEDVSIYNIAYKYLSVASMIYVIIMNPLWPAFTDAKAKADFVWMKHVYHKLVNLFLFFFIGVVIMVVLAPFAYKLWIGSNLNIPMKWTIIIAIYTIINCWDSLHVYIINGLGALRIQSYMVLLGIFFHIPLAYFISTFIGPLGVVYSMIMITSIYSLAFTIQVRKILSKTATGIWLE